MLSRLADRLLAARRVLDPATRWLTWRIVLVALSAVLIVVLPFAFAVAVARDLGVHPQLARVLGVALEAAFILFFYRLGSFFPITAREHDALSIEGVVGGPVERAEARVLP